MDLNLRCEMRTEMVLCHKCNVCGQNHRITEPLEPSKSKDEGIAHVAYKLMCPICGSSLNRFTNKERGEVMKKFLAIKNGE